MPNEFNGKYDAEDSSRYVTLRYVTLRYVTLRYTTLRYVALRCVTLRYVVRVMNHYEAGVCGFQMHTKTELHND